MGTWSAVISAYHTRIPHDSLAEFSLKIAVAKEHLPPSLGRDLAGHAKTDSGRFDLSCEFQLGLYELLSFLWGRSPVKWCWQMCFNIHQPQYELRFMFLCLMCASHPNSAFLLLCLMCASHPAYRKRNTEQT